MTGSRIENVHEYISKVMPKYRIVSLFLVVYEVFYCIVAIALTVVGYQPAWLNAGMIGTYFIASLCIVGMSAGFASFTVRRLLVSKRMFTKSTVENSVQAYFSAYMVSVTIAGFIGLAGFIVFLLFRNLTVLFVMSIISMVFKYRHKISVDEMTEFVQTAART